MKDLSKTGMEMLTVADVIGILTGRQLRAFLSLNFHGNPLMAKLEFK